MASATQAPGLGARIGEYFTLRGAAEAQAKLGEPARKTIEAALALGRQRAEGAEALWSNGHTAEALRLAVESLLETLKAAPAYGEAMALPAPAPAAEPAAEAPAADAAEASEKKDDAEGEKAEASGDAEKKDEAEGEKAAEASEKADEKPAKAEAEKKPEEKKAEPAKKADAPAKLPDEPWSVALAARGVPAARIDKAKVAVAAARTTKLPLLDADVSPASAEMYEQILDARHTIDGAFAMVALPARDLGWTRFSRMGTTALVAVLVVVGLLVATHEPEGVFADASDTWNQAPQFVPENVIDGRPDTYWLLPDGASGWVEARISPPVHVDHVTVLNTANPPHFDRGTRDYTIEVYSGGEVVERVDGTMEFSRTPQPITEDISADSVERIRFVVRSHHNVGAGLAELSWD